MGQNFVSPGQVVLTNRSVNNDSGFHQLFSMLSVNNEKNINSLQLTVSYRQFVENSKQGVKVSWKDVAITGDTRFRDFAFDTLLMPDKVLVTFTWPSKNSNQLLKQQFEASFPATNLLFNLQGYEGEGLTIKVDFAMSKVKYSHFVNMAGLANHYYGFYSVLTNILNHKNAEGRMVLLNYLELHRALYSIDHLKLIQLLRLKIRDPEKLLPLIKRAARLETRERTLSKKQLNKSKPGFREGEVANGLADLSVKYLTNESRYQPYLAASYELMAKLTNDPETVAFYKMLCNRFAAVENDGTGLCQLVFNAFLNRAEQYNTSEQYSFAMIMLDNAQLWSQVVKNVVEQPVFGNRLNSVLDGMMTSYLKVAAAGYRTGNRAMGLRYEKKADDLFKKISHKYPEIVRNSQPRFQSMLVRLAKDELSKNQTQSMLDMFFRFRYLNFSPQEKNAVFEMKSQAYQKLCLQYIGLAETALNSGNIDEAYKRMKTVKDYCSLRSNYVKNNKTVDKRLEKTAYGLILEFIQRGEILLDRGESDRAMQNFSTALGLQNDFLSYRLTRLDELMAQTAVPVILSEIEKAELEVWANKMEEAKKHYNRIVAFQNRYFLEQNPKVNSKVSQLREMLENRVCVDARYSLSNYLQVAQNRIKQEKWEEAAVALDKAEKLIRGKRNCPLDTTMILGLRYRYRFALAYAVRYDSVTDRLYAYGYEKVWKQLAALDAFYAMHKLDLLGVKPSGQYRILKSQQNPNNVKRVVKYYLSKGDAGQALRYLMLLKDFGVSSRQTKPLQIELAKSMAGQLSESRFRRVVDTNDEWLQPLVKTYTGLIR